MKVTSVERRLLELPFRDRPLVHMSRLNLPWNLVEVCIVSSDDGLEGYGETIIHYTWSGVNDEQVAKVVGTNPFIHLWDDSLGAGLQMALYDLAGKALGVPCYRLLGHKVRDECPISWWTVDMPPEDWAEEAKLATRLGYCNAKLKARPWFDIFSQVLAVSEATPENFEFDLDFNSFLLNADHAAPILTELEKFSKVSIFETPIPQDDVSGYKKIKTKVKRPLAIHYGSPPAMTALEEKMCDGFILSGGTARVTQQAAVAAEADKPFWLQLVGTGLTTAFTLHLGSVLSHARWPAITCQEIYSDDLIKDKIEVHGGHAHVPERPGLGVEVDEDALEKLRVEPTAHRHEAKMRFKISWPDGRTMQYERTEDYYRDFAAGKLPGFQRGVKLETV